MTIPIHPESPEGQRLAAAQRIQAAAEPLAAAATQAAGAVQQCEAEIIQLEQALQREALNDDFDHATAEMQLSRARRKLPLLRQASEQAHAVYTQAVAPLHELGAIGMQHQRMLAQV